MSDALPKEVAPPPPRSSRDLATVGDVNRAAAGEKFVTWISSGLGALATLAGICLILMTGAWVVVDRSESKATEAAIRETSGVKQDLSEFKQTEEREHSWTRDMLFRQEKKSDAMLDRWGIANPVPAVPPPPPLHLDGGP